MKYTMLLSLLLVLSISKAQENKFQWPEGKTMAVSLTWDDGRKSQVEYGLPVLEKYGVKATFYVVPKAVEEELEGWKKVVAAGHEIANHSINHPCSGNFLWARDRALEEYSLYEMRAELKEADKKIKELLDVDVTEFAYPCGQTFIGRESNTKSYVPIISEDFVSGRTWMDEAPNDPSYCDLAQLTGMEMDGKDIKYIMSLIEMTRKDGLWLVLAGHDIGLKGRQTTEVKMLKKLFSYLNNHDEIWVAPVGEISKYIAEKRS
ncbi:MAG: polysaccharide deacetylase family protein [Cyclobacteriaceae bacterium]